MSEPWTEWYERAEKIKDSEELMNLANDMMWSLFFSAKSSNELSSYDHIYDSYAEGAAALLLAAGNLMSDKLGLTGFQASFAFWRFAQRWLPIDGPAGLLKLEDMLYPQYKYKFTAISLDDWNWLQAEAQKRLNEREGMHADVRAHMTSIVEGHVPFGFKVLH